MFCLKSCKIQASAALIVAGLFAACSTPPLGPDGEYQVSSAADNFTLTMLHLEDAVTTRTYEWENTGTQATVYISQILTSGSVILTIQDAAGTVVHQSDVADDFDGDTEVGVAGNWTIEVDLQNAYGMFDISIIKKT
jgi:hypothetical protein